MFIDDEDKWHVMAMPRATKMIRFDRIEPAAPVEEAFWMGPDGVPPNKRRKWPENRQWYPVLCYRGPDGIWIGRHAMTIHPEVLSAAGHPNRRVRTLRNAFDGGGPVEITSKKNIRREVCVPCGGSTFGGGPSRGIAACSAISCPAWPYRHGHDPHQPQRQNLPPPPPPSTTFEAIEKPRRVYARNLLTLVDNVPGRRGLGWRKGERGANVPRPLSAGVPSFVERFLADPSFDRGGLSRDDCLIVMDEIDRLLAAEAASRVRACA